ELVLAFASALSHSRRFLTSQLPHWIWVLCCPRSLDELRLRGYVQVQSTEKGHWRGGRGGSAFRGTPKPAPSNLPDTENFARAEPFLYSREIKTIPAAPGSGSSHARSFCGSSQFRRLPAC